jgi:ParB family chromosome partitioning protein
VPRTEWPERFENFQNIPLDQLRPNEEQPRETFDAQKLEELAQSIQTNGLIQPITVRREGSGMYTIIAGERRWRAARLAGLKEIPALVRSVEQNRVLELALIENLQREDLNPVETAAAFQRLVSEHGLSHEEIAERTGKDRSTITNFLRILKLSPLVLNELTRGTISMGHARALLNIANADAQMDACRRIVSNQLSVRDTERLVKSLTNPENESQVEANKDKKIDPNIRAALDEMAAALSTRVRLVPRAGSGGRLEIEYYSQDDLDRIYSRIVNQ